MAVSYKNIPFTDRKNMTNAQLQQRLASSANIITRLKCTGIFPRKRREYMPCSELWR